jgi:hypothetical protein
MKLAETVRSRCALMLVSAVFGATAIIAASQTCTKRPVAKSMKTRTVQPWGGCHQRRVAPTPPPPRVPSGSDYRDVLLAARPAIEACTRKQPSGVFYEIRLPISAEGRVTSVEVRGKNKNLSKVSMKVVKCLEQAVSPLQFPATGERTFVSTGIMTPTLIANTPDAN